MTHLQCTTTLLGPWHKHTVKMLIYPLSNRDMNLKSTTASTYHRTQNISCIILFLRWAGHVARMGEERGYIGSCWGNRRGGGYWGDLGVDGWIILGCISRRWDVAIWTGLGWPRIETVGRRL